MNDRGENGNELAELTRRGRVDSLATSIVGIGFTSPVGAAHPANPAHRRPWMADEVEYGLVAFGPRQVDAPHRCGDYPAPFDVGDV